jgi:hypothetical protein
MAYETFEIAEAEHLEGLKTFPDRYRPAIAQFLRKVAHAS